MYEECRKLCIEVQLIFAHRSSWDKQLTPLSPVPIACLMTDDVLWVKIHPNSMPNFRHLNTSLFEEKVIHSKKTCSQVNFKTFLSQVKGLGGWFWFKRYILLGPRAGALALLQGLVYGGRSTYSEARPGIWTRVPGVEGRYPTSTPACSPHKSKGEIKKAPLLYKCYFTKHSQASFLGTYNTLNRKIAHLIHIYSLCPWGPGHEMFQTFVYFYNKFPWTC